MKRKTAPRGTTRNRQLLLEVVLAAPWIAAVAAINVDWQAADLNTKVATVVSIAASALFWTAALRHKGSAVGVFYAGLALILVALNATTAFGVLHKQTLDSRDYRGAIAGTVAERSAQRSRLSQARAEAAVIAGERPTETLRAEIDGLAAANASRWRATRGCAADRITLAASAAFCAQVAARKAALAAAQRRDDIDAEFAALNREASKAPAVVEADPFGSGLAQLAAAVGLPLSRESQALLPTFRDALRALLLELVGAMGPAATLSLVGVGGPVPRVRHRPSTIALARQLCRRLLAVGQAAVVARASAGSTSEPLGLFLAERTEAAKGESVAAGELWAAWVSWCNEKRIGDVGTQKSFGLRLSMRYRREGTGRPRYVGLRLLQTGPCVVPLPNQARRCLGA